VRPGGLAVSGQLRRGSPDGSDRDDQLVIDLDELNDHVRELAGDELLVSRGARVRVVGGLIGEMSLIGKTFTSMANLRCELDDGGQASAYGLSGVPPDPDNPGR